MCAARLQSVVDASWHHYLIAGGRHLMITISRTVVSTDGGRVDDVLPLAGCFTHAPAATHRHTG